MNSPALLRLGKWAGVTSLVFFAISPAAWLALIRYDSVYDEPFSIWLFVVAGILLAGVLAAAVSLGALSLNWHRRSRRR